MADNVVEDEKVERRGGGMVKTCCGLTDFQDEEARGYVIMGGARGFAILTGVLYITLAVNTVGAGLADSCDTVDFGLFKTQYTSVVSLVGTIEASITMVLSPIFGAVADLSEHRKTMYKVVQFIWAFMSVIHIILLMVAPSPALLLIFGLTIVVQSVFYELSYVLHFSFLPEIGRGNDHLVSELSAKYYVVLNIFQFLCVLLVSGPQFALGIFLEENPLNPFVTAQYASALVFLSCAYYTYRSLKLIKARPASHTMDNNNLANNTNPVVLGFKRVFKTLKEIWTKYPQVVLFLIGFMFLMGTVAAVVSLSTVYFQSQLGLGADMISFVVLCSLVFSIPGSLLGNALKSRIPIKRVMIGITLLWMFAIGTAPLVMTGQPGPVPEGANSTANATTCPNEDQVILTAREPRPMDIPLAFLYAAIWGIGIGSSYPVAASFYSLIIPGGQEAEYFGARTFLLKVASLFPPALFFTINEATKRLDYAYISLTPFVLIAAIAFACINMDSAKAHIEDTLHLRRMRRKSGVLVFDAEEGTLMATKDSGDLSSDDK